MLSIPPRSWSFGRKISVGFAVVTTLVLLIGVVSNQALRLVVRGNSFVFDHALELLETEHAHASAERLVASSRGFLLSGDREVLFRMNAIREELAGHLEELRRLATTPEERSAVSQLENALQNYTSSVDRVIQLPMDRRAPAPSHL